MCGHPCDKGYPVAAAFLIWQVLLYAARSRGATAVGFDVRRSCIDSTHEAAVAADVRPLVEAYEHDFFDQERLVPLTATDCH